MYFIISLIIINLVKFNFNYFYQHYEILHYFTYKNFYYLFILFDIIYKLQIAVTSYQNMLQMYVKIVPMFFMKKTTEFKK